jgi:hypothetical protein
MFRSFGTPLFQILLHMNACMGLCKRCYEMFLNFQIISVNFVTETLIFQANVVVVEDYCLLGCDTM